MEMWTRWIFRLLLISFTTAHGLNDFPQNFIMAKRNDVSPVTLTCGEQTDGDLTWKFDGEVIEDLDDNMELHNQSLILSEVDTPMLGEYSCWRGNTVISSTYLLLQKDEEDELDSLLRCRAKSYDCEFSCSWTGNGYAAVRLGLGPDCTEGGKPCHWVRKSDQRPDGGLQFKLSHTLTPYAEESTMLEVTVEAIKNLFIFRKTKRFYLRDIVQPDSSKIVRCQEVGQDLNVTIAPPATWSTPHSFFTLEHEIEYVFKDDGQTGRSSSSLIPKRISKLRVRSRDPLMLSAWSQWTPWKNVTY